MDISSLCLESRKVFRAAVVLTISLLVSGCEALLPDPLDPLYEVFADDNSNGDDSDGGDGDSGGGGYN